MRVGIFATANARIAGAPGMALALLCALHVAPPSRSVARETAGAYVADISGLWFVSTNGREDTLRIAYVLSVGSRIVPARPDTGRQSIQILLPSRASMASDCSDTIRFSRIAPCEILLVPPIRKPDSWLQGKLALAMGMLRTHEAERYESLISRGGALRLADGIVRGQGEFVDIAPILAGAAPGRYQLCFVPVDLGNSTAPSDSSCRASIVYDWLPKAPTTAPLPQPVRGLFELRIARASQRSSVWVLIEDADQYASTNRSYARFDTAAMSIRPALTPEAIQRLRRAYLAVLSSPAAKSASASRSR